MHSCIKSFVLSHTCTCTCTIASSFFLSVCGCICICLCIFFSCSCSCIYIYIFAFTGAVTCASACVFEVRFFACCEYLARQGKGPRPMHFGPQGKAELFAQRADCMSDHSLIISLIRSKLHFSFSFFFFSYHLSCAKNQYYHGSPPEIQSEDSSFSPLGLQACLFSRFPAMRADMGFGLCGKA